MTDLLTDTQIQEALGGGESRWHLAGNALERTVELASFPQAIAVVDRIAVIAENADHHPDIDIRWRTLTFRLSTHSEGGITVKDVDLAGEIDAVLDAPGE